MKALSCTQPWAWLMVSGLKPVENRSWATKYRGPLLIHAPKGWDEVGAMWIRKGAVSGELPIKPEDLPFNDKPDGTLPRGAFVGVLKVTDCVTKYESPWFFGPYGFLVKDAVRFNKPFPFKGHLGLFDVSDTIVKEILFENMIDCSNLIERYR